MDFNETYDMHVSDTGDGRLMVYANEHFIARVSTQEKAEEAFDDWCDSRFMEATMQRTEHEDDE